ncbi:MAG: HlyD family secretion protein, partial [Desulfofustis sp.]|nr:HlyD family secretion protein [Desulfofustis sp.]
MNETENPPVPPAKVPAEKPAAQTGNGRRRIGLVLLTLILIGTAIGAWMWYKSKIELTTDDAFIDNHIHLISSRVPGQVIAVRIEDNQKVAANDLLVSLDPAVYQSRVAKSEASLALAENDTGVDKAAIAAAEAMVTQNRAHLDQATIDLQRGKALFAREVIPKERLDQLQTAHKVAKAALEQSLQERRLAQARLGVTGTTGQQARVAESAAELTLARLNLAYTEISAPVAGYVTRKSVQVGNNVQAGQTLLALVQLEDPWIVANYKESQLLHLEPGQRVEFSVDAYPGQTFTGKVDSIMAGTGAAFSLLPPENATGNYVK